MEGKEKGREGKRKEEGRGRNNGAREKIKERREF